MKVIKNGEGKLKMTVSSEGKYISAGTPVVVETIEDNFKNIFVRVTSINTNVRLPYFGTSIIDLI